MSEFDWFVVSQKAHIQAVGLETQAVSFETRHFA